MHDREGMPIPAAGVAESHMKIDQSYCSSSKTVEDRTTAIAISVMFHLLLFAILFMTPPVKNISGSPIIFVTFRDDALLTARSGGSTMSAAGQTELSPARRKEMFSAIPEPPDDQHRSGSSEEGGTVQIREAIATEDHESVKDHMNPGSDAGLTKNDEPSGPAKFGMGGGMAPGGNTVSPAETRFGDRGAPAFVYQEIPVYPALARRLGMEGRVLLKLLIDANGKLLNVEVIESAGYGFTEASIEAVKKSTYAPGVRDGVKVATLALLPVRFRLQ